MLNQSTASISCKDSKNDASPVKALARIASTKLSTPTHLLAQISATGLVLASAGLGAVYAGTTGSQHGIGLASLMVVMAVALEIAKPLSLASAFTAFRSWSVVRGLLLALLALVAISYSLTAELTLMAGARGDVVAKREAVLKAGASAEVEVQRARDRYEAAKAELANLPAARPAGELQAEIDGLQLNPNLHGCTEIDGKWKRELCPKIAALKAEKARAERRTELEAVLDLPMPRSSGFLGTEVKDADPGATALATYLAALGFVVPVPALTEWLALIPVLALEVGSALAGVLVQTLSQLRTRTAQFCPPRAINETVEGPAVVQVVHPASTDDASTREKVKNAILAQLNQRGGSVASSERGLAALIGASRPTVRRAINGLVLAGVLAAEATRHGTMLRLVG